jgi:hypothetical protein
VSSLPLNVRPLPRYDFFFKHLNHFTFVFSFSVPSDPLFSYVLYWMFPFPWLKNWRTCLILFIISVCPDSFGLYDNLHLSRNDPNQTGVVTSTSVFVLIGRIPCFIRTRSWSQRGYIKIQIGYLSVSTCANLLWNNRRLNKAKFWARPENRFRLPSMVRSEDITASGLIKTRPIRTQRQG